MPNPVLPQELIDIVIDFLHSDRETLKACCLVRKAWALACQYHLLSDIIIDRWNYDFIHRSPLLPVLSPYARRLKFAGLTHLPPRLEAFSSITTLILSEVDLDAESTTSLPSIFPLVTSLDLYHVEFSLAGDIFGLVCSFVQLRVLTICCDWKLDTLPPENLQLPRDLRIVNSQNGEFIFKFHPIPPLSIFRLFNLVAINVSSVGSHLKALGVSLQHLDLGFYDFPHASTFLGQINLSHNTNLRSLNVHVAPPYLFLNVLQTALGNKTLESAILTVHDPRNRYYRIGMPCDWPVLDQMVSDYASSRAFSLTFRLGWRGDAYENIVEDVKGHLPRSVGLNAVLFVDEFARLADMKKEAAYPFARSWGLQFPL